MQKRFKPHWTLKNPHVQTLFAPLVRRKEQTETHLEKFFFEDGDFVESVWYKDLPKNDQPIVILFHGLAGSIESPYAKNLMSALYKKGFASVIMHFRGSYQKENLLPRAYHSGDTADAKAWILHIKEKYPDSTLSAVGFSIGGNMLLKLLGEWGEESPLISAVSVSAPMQLDISADTIERGFARVYQQHLLNPLKKSLLQKYKRFDMNQELEIDEKTVENIATIREFDERYTAKIHGFGSAENYYLKCSAKQFLKHITTPTLIIHALDDPFMTPEILPTKDELSPAITLEISEHGGHVGFVSGTALRPKYWLDSRIVNWLISFTIPTQKESIV